MAPPVSGNSDPVGRGEISLLTSIPFAVAVGIVLGYLSGLGVGGGSLLILWLTLVLDMDAGTARAVNLMFFLTAAGSVCLFRLRKGTLHLKTLIPAILCGCCTAAVLSFASCWINRELAKRLFGILFLVTGLRELLYRPRKFR